MAEPTGSIIRMPKVENALGQSTTSAASQKAVTDGITQAKSAASTADGKAVTAQKTANEAKTAAGTAQTAATNANNNANGRVPTSRKINGMDLTADRSITAAQVGAYSKTESDARYQPKGSSSGITLGALETTRSDWTAEGGRAYYQLAWLFAAKEGSGSNITTYPDTFSQPANVVITNMGSCGDNTGARHRQRMVIQFRRITGGI